MADETLRSVLGRASALYGLSSQTLWRDLAQSTGKELGAIDAPSCHGLQALGHVLGVPGRMLRTHQLDEESGYLDPEFRLAMCPACWENDARIGRGRVFRRPWARVLQVTCPQHRRPLQLAPLPNGRWVEDRHAQLGEDERAVLTLIDTFASVLDACLFGLGTWPTHWRADPNRAQAALAHATFGKATGPEVAPVSNVYAPPALALFVHAPRHAIPCKQPSWEAFQQVADPGVRRAALWCVAWAVQPGLASSLSPGWVTVEV